MSQAQTRLKAPNSTDHLGNPAHCGDRFSPTYSVKRNSLNQRKIKKENENKKNNNNKDHLINLK